MRNALLLPTQKRPLVVDIGALREPYYTGIPNVIAELCRRLLEEDWLDIYFEMDGLWIDNDAVRRCLTERSGSSLSRRAEHFLPTATIHEILTETESLSRTAALYTDYRPPRKRYPREGKIVHDLSMILTPECHPIEAAAIYVHDLGEQLACSDILFCVSEATARDLSWIYGIEAERIRIAPLGSNVDLAAVRRMQDLIGFRPVEPFLLVLGSIEPRKNSQLILRWLAEHSDVLADMRVVFAGREAWGKTFAAMIEENNLQYAMSEGRIVFTNFIDESFRTALLVGAAGLIYASVYEGFGLPPLEAMATGTPVLASVSSSIPEVVGECGYYFDPCSVGSLHSAYLSFQSDRKNEKIQGIIARAHQRASEFSYDKTYKIILDGLFELGPG